jgi:polar amino acid transport system substrate-binding protein
MVLAGTAAAQTPSAAQALAPTGTLRAAINFGNPVLVQRGPNGEAEGVTAKLAAELARRLGVPLAIVPFDQAGKVTDALPLDSYDICFLAIDPVRGQGIAFTEPYLVIEGAYAVRDPARFPDVASVDVPGTTVIAVTGSAYDLFLTRALKSAQILRVADNAAAARAFLAGEAPVLAGVRQPVEALVAATPGLSMVPGRFMGIEQAMGVPKRRGEAAAALVRDFVRDATASGFVRDALR